MAEPTEAELVIRAKAGDRRALETLLERHQPHLMRFGLRMCGRIEDAEDVVQESMMAAVRSLPDFRGDASLSTWLYTIARSFCIKKRRRSKYAPQFEESFDDESTRHELRSVALEEASPEEAVLSREMDSALQSAISSLEDGQREVIVLRDVEGLSANEVAKITGLSVGAVKSKLHRARAALRRTLEPLLGDIGMDSFPPSPECPDIEELFSKSLEGEVDADLCHRMQLHVENCPRCKKVCSTLSVVLRTCQATPYPKVPPTVQASVRRALRLMTEGDRAAETPE